MVRVIRNRKSAITPQRNTARRKPDPLKAAITKRKQVQKKRKSCKQAHKVNANIKKHRSQERTGLRKSKNSSPMTSRYSPRFVQRQNICERPIMPYSSCMNNTPIKTTNNICRTPTDTIVIDDSDEENEATDSEMSPEPGVFFYEDRNPGLKELEVPLYQTELRLINPGDANRDESIIVLDSTLETTVNNIQADVEDKQAASSVTGINNNCSLIECFDNGRNGSNPHVIDLSDDSERDEQSGSLYIPIDCVTQENGIVKPSGNINRLPKNHPAKKKVIDNGSSNSAIVAASASINDNETTPKKRMIIIDGNNVSYGHLNGKMFSVKGLDLCINYFKKLGHEVVAVVPQYKLKRTQSTDQGLLEKLHRQGDVILAPSKSLPGQCSSTYDDRLILSVAEQFDGVVVSNDNFRDLLDSCPSWRRIIKTRVIGYTWVKDCFFLPDDPYGRQGPSLNEILSGYSA